MAQKTPSSETEPLLSSGSHERRGSTTSTLFDPETAPSAAAVPPISPSTTRPARNPNHWLGLYPSPLIIIPPLFLHVFAIATTVFPFAQFMVVVVCQMLGENDNAPNATMVGTSMTWTQNYTQPISASWFKGLDPDRFPPFEKCSKRADVLELKAYYSQIINLASAIPSLILAPVVGQLVDRLGRRTMMIPPILSAVIGVISYIAVGQLGIGIWLLVAVHLVQGFMGGSTALVTSIYAYLADSSDSGQRTQKFLMVDAFMFSAFMLGPAIGGFVATNIGVLFAFYAALFMEAFVVAYVIFIVPESKRKAKATPEPAPAQAAATTTESTPLVSATPAQSSNKSESLLSSLLGSWGMTLSVLFAPGRGWSVPILTMVTAVSSIVFSAYPFAFFDYPAKMFGWNSAFAGYFSLANSIMRVIYLALVLPTLLRVLLKDKSPVVKIRTELMLIRVGILFYVFGFLAYGLATKGWMFFVIAILDGFGVVALPTTRGILSRTVPNSKQGRLFAAIETLQSIAGLASTLIMPPIFRNTIGTRFPQTIFFVVSGIWACALALTAWTKSRELISLTPEQDNEGMEDPATRGTPGANGDAAATTTNSPVYVPAPVAEAVAVVEETGIAKKVVSLLSAGEETTEEVLERVEQEAEVIIDETARELMPGNV
ncbi:hypothetical protein HDU97_003231 [Phlyctochytrium planicorne]|nr:hypothetical protein HDU97_003231 [Phlyctochytrium planicorne]